MKNSRLYILLAVAGLISILLAVWLWNAQKKSSDKKIGVKRAANQMIRLSQPEQIDHPVVNDEGQLVYFSDDDNSFYGLNFSGQRTLKCALGEKDLAVDSVIYGDNSAIIFGVKRLSQADAVRFINFASCTTKELNSMIQGANWSDKAKKYVFSEADPATQKTKIILADGSFSHQETLASLDGELMNVVWLDANNIAFSFLSTDPSPIDVYKINRESKKRQIILEKTDQEFLTPGRNGLMANKRAGGKGFMIMKFNGEKFIKQKDVYDSRLKNMGGLYWLSDKELVVTTSNEYGNTKDVWLYDLNGKLWRLDFDRNGYDYSFSDFLRLDDSRIIGISESVPYILTIK